MSCIICKNKLSCAYDVLKDFEECYCYPPCRFISIKHQEIINNHIRIALESFDSDFVYYDCLDLVY